MHGSVVEWVVVAEVCLAEGTYFLILLCKHLPSGHTTLGPVWLRRMRFANLCGRLVCAQLGIFAVCWPALHKLFFSHLSLVLPKKLLQKRMYVQHNWGELTLSKWFCLFMKGCLKRIISSAPWEQIFSLRVTSFSSDVPWYALKQT